MDLYLCWRVKNHSNGEGKWTRWIQQRIPLCGISVVTVVGEPSLCGKNPCHRAARLPWPVHGMRPPSNLKGNRMLSIHVILDMPLPPFKFLCLTYQKVENVSVGWLPKQGIVRHIQIWNNCKGTDASNTKIGYVNHLTKQSAASDCSRTYLPGVQNVRVAGYRHAFFISRKQIFASLLTQSMNFKCVSL